MVVVVVEVMVVVVVPLLQLLPLTPVGGELVAGELVEDGLTAGRICLWLLLLLQLLLPRLLLVLRRRLVVVVVVPLLQLLPLLPVGGEDVARELAEDGLAAGGIVSGC